MRYYLLLLAAGIAVFAYTTERMGLGWVMVCITPLRGGITAACVVAGVSFVIAMRYD